MKNQVNQASPDNSGVSMDQLRYPIGQFEMPRLMSRKIIMDWIEEIRKFPGQLQGEVGDLPDDALSLLHRPGGWTIRQLVHHCADSHMNGFIRQKLALAEDNPTIKPYEEALWANQIDETMPVAVSLTLLESVHARWHTLLVSLSDRELERTYFHPAADKKFTLLESTGDYAWHGRHHLAHIRQALGGARSQE